MEIERLTALIRDRDLNDMVGRLLTGDRRVRGIQLRVRPDGVQVVGEFRALVWVGFESLWDVGVDDGRLKARLTAFAVAGVVGRNMVKSALLALIQGALAGARGLRMEGETVWADPEQLLADEGFDIRLNLVAVRPDAGGLIVHCGDTNAVSGG
jgi:hypothetical protein